MRNPSTFARYTFAAVALAALPLGASASGAAEPEQPSSLKGRGRHARDLQETNAILAHFTVQTIGSLPEGVAVPPASLCSARGWRAYERSAVEFLDCSVASYAAVCAMATEEHERACQEFCQAVTKRGRQDVRCIGISNPLAAAFDRRQHCIEIPGSSGETTTFVLCTVEGDCKCDP